MTGHRRAGTFPAPMLLLQDFPEVFDVRIPRVHKSLPPMPSDIFEALVGIAVTGDYMVARPQLLQHPSIKPGQKAKPKGLRLKRRQGPRRRVSPKADPGIQPRELRRNARGAAPGAQGQET